MKDIDLLNKKLKEACLINGMCKDYREKWQSDKTYQELIDTMKSDPLFVYRVPYIRNEMFSNYFDHNLLKQNDIYVNNDFITELNTNCIFLFGDSKINVSLNKGEYKFYLFENSCLDINVSDECFIKIYLLERSKCAINTQNIKRKPIIELIDNECTINTDNTDIIIYKRPGFSKSVKEKYNLPLPSGWTIQTASE